MDSTVMSAARLLREVPIGRLRALPEQRHPIVMVLGMHRSGTSLCSHVLSVLGLDMADTVSGHKMGHPASDNPNGHWERWEIVDLHDRILDLLNRPYTSIGHDFMFPVGWWADPRVSSVRREIMDFLERRIRNGKFGFKDPRTVRLLPLWHQIFSELKLEPKIIYCIRNPAQVARSLQVRDGLSRDLGEYRWLCYNMEFFRYVRANEFCTIEYETWFNESSTNLKKLRSFLDVSPNQHDPYIDDAVSKIINRELRHDDSSLDSAAHPLIRSTYKLARQAEQDAAARKQLQDIASEFVSFQQLQAAFERDFEHNAKRATQVPALEQDITELRVQLHERDARLDAARLEFAARDQQLHEFEAEVAQLRAALAAAKESSDAHQHSLNSLRAELFAMRAAVAAEQETLEKRKTEAAQMQREITALRELLSQAELSVRTAESRVAEAERNAEFAECKTSEAARNASGLESRIGALTAEIASVREVGRAAIELAVSSTGAVFREPRLGWRQKSRQLFKIIGKPCKSRSGADARITTRVD